MNIKLNPDSVRRAVMQEEARKIAHDAVVDAHVYTRERYGVRYQDSAYYQLLRRDGIDMAKIEDELDEYAKERGAISE